MNDDPRMNAAIDMILDHWYNGNDWRISMSGEYIKDARERVFHGLKAALDILVRPEEDAPTFPAWNADMAALVVALSAVVSGMVMKSDRIQELRWPDGGRELKSGATAATMLDDRLRAAFPDPAREG